MIGVCLFPQTELMWPVMATYHNNALFLVFLINFFRIQRYLFKEHHVVITQGRKPVLILVDADFVVGTDRVVFVFGRKVSEALKSAN